MSTPYTRIEALDRVVCALTGDVRSPDPDGYIDPWKAVEALNPISRADFDAVVKQRDDARDELANMIDLAREVGRLGDFLRHMTTDRDDQRERADELEDKYLGAQCRMDEMAAEIRELRGAL